MPTITDPDTGKTIEIEPFDGPPPTEHEIKQMFRARYPDVYHHATAQPRTPAGHPEGGGKFTQLGTPKPLFQTGSGVLGAPPSILDAPTRALIPQAPRNVTTAPTRTLPPVKHNPLPTLPAWTPRGANGLNLPPDAWASVGSDGSTRNDPIKPRGATTPLSERFIAGAKELAGSAGKFVDTHVPHTDLAGEAGAAEWAQGKPSPIQHAARAAAHLYAHPAETMLSSAGGVAAMIASLPLMAGEGIARTINPSMYAGDPPEQGYIPPPKTRGEVVHEEALKLVGGESGPVMRGAHAVASAVRGVAHLDKGEIDKSGTQALQTVNGILDMAGNDPVMLGAMWHGTRAGIKTVTNIASAVKSGTVSRIDGMKAIKREIERQSPEVQEYLARATQPIVERGVSPVRPLATAAEPMKPGAPFAARMPGLAKQSIGGTPEPIKSVPPQRAATVPEKLGSVPESVTGIKVAPKNQAGLASTLKRVYNLSDDEAHHTAILENARALQWARETGKPVEAWYKDKHYEVGGAYEATGKDTLNQTTPDDLGFYSHAERVVDQKMGGRASAQQVRGMLNSNGVKPDEMHWSGLNDFLDAAGDKPVTKQEVLDHLQQNNVKLEEVTKGKPEPISITDWRKTGDTLLGTRSDGRTVKIEHDPRYDYAYDVTNGPYGDTFRTLDEAKNWLQESVEREVRDKATAGTRYGKYQLPDGKNYREHLLTMPRRERSTLKTLTERMNNASRSDSDSIYRSSHWDEPNVLAHIRTSDRTGPNGEKILHVEEIQSDWGQAGRKRGFVDEVERKAKDGEYAKLNEERNALIAKYPEAHGSLLSARGHMSIADRIHERDLTRRLVEVAPNTEPGVPAMPFSKTWHELAMKRIFKMAADGDYDKVAWTKGEAQGKRYPEDDGGPKDQARTEGMKGFYDKILPDYANKLGKRFNTRVQDIEMSGLPEYPTRQAYEGPGYTLDDMRRLLEFSRGNDYQNGRTSPLTGQRQDYTIQRVDVYRHVGDIVHEMELGATLEEAMAKHGTMGIADILGGELKQHTDPQVFDLHSIDIPPEMRKSLTTEGQPLFQDQGGLKGSVTFKEDGASIRRGLTAPDVSTAVHEFAHVMRRTLHDNDMRTLEDHYGVKDGKWSVAHEERFAGNFERYLRDGRAPTDKLRETFAKMKQWLTDIYQSIKGTPLEEEISPVLRDIFDRALGKETETVKAEAPKPTISTVKPAGGKYARSVNVPRMGLDAAGEQVVRDTAAGLGERPKYSPDDGRRMPTMDDIHAAKVGEYPQWVKTDNQRKAFQADVRDVFKHRTNLATEAIERARTNPTAENKAAAAKALEDQAVSQEYSANFSNEVSEQLRAHIRIAEDFETVRQNDIFRTPPEPTPSPVATAIRKATNRSARTPKIKTIDPNAPDVFAKNKVYKQEQFDAARSEFEQILSKRKGTEKVKAECL